MFEWHKKEAPVFTGVTRGVGGFGFGKAAAAAGPTGPFSATGGNVVNQQTIGGLLYKVHIFTSSGNFIVSSGGSLDVLVVAGGGSGGVDNGGGGGAGGVIDAPMTVSAQSYPIVVGDGGVQRNGSQNCGDGYRGKDSTAFGLTAKGGGAGLGWDDTCPYDDGESNVGGSGGGQSSSPTGANSNGSGPATQPAQSGNSGTFGYGYPGGTASSGLGYGGGGGGAGGAGLNATPTNSGRGGIGYGPVSPKYGTGIGFNDGTNSNMFAAGGTGGWDVFAGKSSPNPSVNGVAKQGNSQTAENDCLSNTGCGGHGANHNDQDSGTGGSGIVVIRYRI